MMKQKKTKYLLILIIFSFYIILAGCGTKPIERDLEGFLGIVWEENVSNAVSILRDNNFRIMYSDDRGIGAEGLFLDEEVYLTLLFSNNRFYIVSISFRNKINLIEVYNKTIDLLIEKYGRPYLVHREFPGIPTKSTTWRFRNNCSISIYFDSELNFINIQSSNNTILNEATN